jgi:hypothetical protein
MQDFIHGNDFYSLARNKSILITLHCDLHEGVGHDVRELPRLEIRRLIYDLRPDLSCGVLSCYWDRVVATRPMDY